jgi:hypothetical protein
VDYRLPLAAAAALALAKGSNLAQHVDYALLLTFVGFFVFVGNLTRSETVRGWLTALMDWQPFVASALASQVISNVPAAVLLAEFTVDGRDLLAGVSAGGCGTLIASMASLISYRLFVAAGGNSKRYLFVFTLYNAVFLLVMAFAWMLARG